MFFLNNDPDVKEAMRNAYNAAKNATKDTDEEKQAIKEIAEGLGISIEDAEKKVRTFINVDPTLTGDQFTERMERGFKVDSSLFVENITQQINNCIESIEKKIQSLPEKYYNNPIFKEDILGDMPNKSLKGIKYLQQESDQLKQTLLLLSPEGLLNEQDSEKAILREQYKQQYAQKAEWLKNLKNSYAASGDTEPSDIQLKRQISQNIINAFIGGKRKKVEDDFYNFSLSARNVETTLNRVIEYEANGTEGFQKAMLDFLTKTNPNEEEDIIQKKLAALIKEYEKDPVGISMKMARTEQNTKKSQEQLNSILSTFESDEARQEALKKAEEVQKSQESVSGDPVEIKVELDGIKRDLKSSETFINSIKNTEVQNYVKEILEKYKEEFQKRNSHFEMLNATDEDNSEFIQLHKSVNKLSINAKSIFEELKDRPELLKNDDQGLGFSFVSPVAIWDVVKNIYEVFIHEFEHTDKRNTAEMQQRVSGLLGDLIPGTWGNYLKQASNKGAGASESIDAEEREEWKKNYENDDNPTLISRLYKWKDMDSQHLRAIIEMLADKGLLRLDDPRLWKALTDLTGIEMPAEEAKYNIIFRDAVLGEMFFAAFGDSSLFKNIRSKADKSFWSQTEERNKDAKDYVSNGTAEGEMAKLLHRHFEAAKSVDYFKPEKDCVMNEYGQINLKNPQANPQYFNDTRLDPHMYTSIFTHWMDTQGSSIEDKIFYLVRGVATGFIPFEATQYIDMKGHHNQIAYMNFFRTCDMNKIMELDQKFTGGKKINDPNLTAEQRNKIFFEGDKDLIVDVLNDFISNDGGVKDRVGRIARDAQNIDKDDWQSMLHLMPPSSVPDLFNLGSGKQKIDIPGIKNGMTGFSTRLSAIQVNDKKEIKQDSLMNIRNSLATFIYIDSSTRGRGPAAEDKEGKLTLKDAEYDEVPGMAGDANLSTRQFAAIPKNFFAEFLRSIGHSDEKINLLFDDERQSDSKYVGKQKEYVKQFYSKDINKIFANSENQKKFAYILENWQDKGVFATYRNKKNAVKYKTIIYGEIHEDLKFNQEEFESWKKGEDVEENNNTNEIKEENEGE